MTNRESFLINPETETLAFKIVAFEGDEYFKKLQDFNYHSIAFIRGGNGRLQIDLDEYEFGSNSLLRLPMHKPFRLNMDNIIYGVFVQFHSDFFWNHKHSSELPCRKVLFNNDDQSPIISLEDNQKNTLWQLLSQVLSELPHDALGKYELVISQMKVFLINACRIRLKQGHMEIPVGSEGPTLLRALNDAIEAHFKVMHKPAEYAEHLNVTVKVLNRLAKAQLKKTATTLISERIITEAKRELYLTIKPIKNIAYELGFNDKAYFSRFFKSNTGMSPQFYRDSLRAGKIYKASALIGKTENVH